MKNNPEVSVHINNKYISSNTYDLDVFDRYTLHRAIESLAYKINFWIKRDRPDRAKPYIEFKTRIKAHLYGW